MATATRLRDVLRSSLLRRAALTSVLAGLAGSAAVQAQERVIPAQRWPAAAAHLKTLSGSHKNTAWRCRGALGSSNGSGSLALSAPSPDPTDVLHYRLEVEIIPSTSTLIGANTVTFQANQPGIDTLRLRLTDLLPITRVTSSAGAALNVTRVNARTIDVHLGQVFNAGQQSSVRVEYAGTPPALGLGAFVFQTTPDGPLVHTLSQPYYAYAWWPAKDGTAQEPTENSDRATVETWITAPNNLKTVAAGRLMGVDGLDGGRARYRWSTQYEIPAYLVFFSSGPFTTWTKSFAHAGGSMPVEFSVLPSQDTPALRAGWEESLTLLDEFGQMFGPYPFLNEKFGVYWFGGTGGVEHPTCAGLNSYSFQAVAHELAHQWWGDAVTCRTWNDNWLSEGFASYAEALAWERLDGVDDPNRSDYWMNEQRAGAQWIGLTVYRNNTASPSSIYGPSVYNKGAWVLHQLRHYVGLETFLEILVTYRNAFEGDAATTEDFAEIASQVAGEDLHWFFDQWVYRVGAPRFGYGWRRERIAGQEYAFLSIDQTQLTSYGEFRVPIDVELTTADGPQVVRVWSDARQDQLVVPASAKVTNVTLDPRSRILKSSQQRVAYAAGSPKLLTASPKPGSLSPSSAAAQQLTLQFSERLSALGAVRLQDALGNDIPLALQHDAQRYRANLTLPTPLGDGTYTVTISDGFTAQASGQRFDGELGPAGALLPSGDGQPGGACVFTFRLASDCLADLDGNGAVDLQDLLAILGGFGGSAEGPDEGDLTGDGVVGVEDLLFALSAYGRGCP